MDGQTKVLNTHAIEYLLMWTRSLLEGTRAIPNTNYSIKDSRRKLRA